MKPDKLIDEILEYCLEHGAVSDEIYSGKKFPPVVNIRVDKLEKFIKELEIEARITELEKLIIPSAIHGYLLKCSGNDIADRIATLKGLDNGKH